VNELQAFRAAARKKNMPDEAVDWWLRLARPCLRLEKDDSGPVVGYFGGRPALPASVAWPEDCVHLASIDLAAIPGDTHDLNLPGDGTLVFFSVTDSVPDIGQVVHVPAGTAVTEAEPPASTATVYDRIPLSGRPDWSLPERPWLSLRYAGEDRDDARLYQELVWDLGYDDRGDETVAVLGGFGTSNTGGLGIPVTPETEVLLVEFHLTDDLVGEDFETDYATLFYVITRADLAAHRFEGVMLASDFHG
jgi:hypothetical protein